MAKRTLLNWLHLPICGVVAIGILAVAEFALRLHSPWRTYTVDGLRTLDHLPEESVYEFHPRTLLRLKKNLESTFLHHPDNGGRTISWRTNAQGYRGDALVPDSFPRVVVYGDSNVMAQFSELRDTFGERLEQGLRAAYPQVEVVNAGVVGHGPDQVFFKMAEEIPQLQPDLVIQVVFADNDFGDLIRNRLFDLREDGGLRPRGDDRGKPDLTPLLMARNLVLVQALRRPVEGRGIEPETLLARTREEYRIFSAGRARAKHPIADYYDVDLALFPDRPSSLAKLKLMGGILGQIRHLLDQHDVPLVVMVLPSSRDSTTHLEPNHEDLAEYGEYDKTRLSEAVARMLDEHGICSLNLWSVFGQNAERFYLKAPEDHWNELGQKRAAEAMAAVLLGQASEPPCPAVVERALATPPAPFGGGSEVVEER